LNEHQPLRLQPDAEVTSPRSTDGKTTRHVAKNHDRAVASASAAEVTRHRRDPAAAATGREELPLGLADSGNPQPASDQAAPVAGKAAARAMRASRLGLELDEAISYDHWARVGERLAGHVDASCWWLGDWLLFGEQHYASRYAEAIASSGLRYKTLRNYAVVARRFVMSRRRDTLSFQHHAEVSALADAEQEHWLDLAETNRWSKAELRAQLRERAIEPKATGATTVRIVVRQDHCDRWRRAAAHDACDFTEWVVRALDDAATRAIEPLRLSHASSRRSA
jgi:hypothetical protein